MTNIIRILKSVGIMQKASPTVTDISSENRTADIVRSNGFSKPIIWILFVSYVPEPSCGGRALAVAT